MSRKTQQATRGSSDTPTVPFWAWLTLGVLIGVGLSAFALWQDWVPALRGVDGPQPNPQASAARAGDPGVAPETGTQPPATTKPSFDFYQILPEMEVVVPDNELAAQAAAQAQGQPPTTPVPPPAGDATPATGAALFLQAGSFRSETDAEQLKARLALTGERASVVPVTVNGVAWFRVRVGPYADAVALDNAKRQLAANGIDAIALRQTQ
jgi:cell division protein FtsN